MAEKAEVLRKTKSMLRSVLLSAPRGVVSRRMQSEYQSLTGKTIPYKELGYPTLESFLDSIPDVIASGIGVTGEMTYFGRADSSTEHIAKLVAKQKKGKVKRPIHPPPPSHTPNKFFGYSPASKPSRSYPHGQYMGKRKTLLNERAVPLLHRPVRSQGMLYSMYGKGKSPVDVNTARHMTFKVLSSNLAMSKKILVCTCVWMTFMSDCML